MAWSFRYILVKKTPKIYYSLYYTVVEIFFLQGFTNSVTIIKAKLHIDLCVHSLFAQVVDMRWGVRDEATDDHSTTDLCLKEIKNCQKISIGPNFVV